MRSWMIFLACSSLIIAAAVIASLRIQRRTHGQLAENEAALRQKDEELVRLATENQQLSNRVAQTATSIAAGVEPTNELAQLRGKAEALRLQASQLAGQLAERRLLTGTRLLSSGDYNLLDHNKEQPLTLPGLPREAGKLNDARALTAALRAYAEHHQGVFPANVDQVSPYLPKPLGSNSPPSADAPLSGTNDFEIVFQGSQDDLTNIPPRRVALIRERQPWPTDEGKWARVYGYADGATGAVESDDNFRSWDAQHVIPLRTTP